MEVSKCWGKRESERVVVVSERAKMTDVADVELKEMSKKGEEEKSTQEVSTKQELGTPAPGLFGISYAGWASIVGALLTLWLSLGFFYWLLINVAVKMRNNDYKGAGGQFRWMMIACSGYTHADTERGESCAGDSELRASFLIVRLWLR